MFKMNKPPLRYTIRADFDTPDRGLYWYVPRLKRWVAVSDPRLNQYNRSNTQRCATIENAFKAAYRCPYTVVEVVRIGRRVDKVWTVDKRLK